MARFPLVEEPRLHWNIAPSGKTFLNAISATPAQAAATHTGPQESGPRDDTLAGCDDLSNLRRYREELQKRDFYNAGPVHDVDRQGGRNGP